MQKVYINPGENTTDEEQSLIGVLQMILDIGRNGWLARAIKGVCETTGDYKNPELASVALQELEKLENKVRVLGFDISYIIMKTGLVGNNCGLQVITDETRKRHDTNDMDHKRN